MFGWFFPRYPRHIYRRHRRRGLGRSLLWGLLIGPWLFRRALRWGAGGRRGWYGGGYGRGYGRGYGGGSGGPRYF
jgi:hypothetical protein